jgi:hypothetical protein
MARVLVGFTALVLLVVTAAVGARRPSTAYAIDCDTFLVQSVAQAYLRNEDADTYQLDGANDNGVACEELQCPCDTEAIPAMIGDNPAVAAPTVRAVATNTTVAVATDTPQPTATDVPIATMEAAAPSATPVAADTMAPTSNTITPPSTGDGGLVLQ